MTFIWNGGAAVQESAIDGRTAESFKCKRLTSSVVDALGFDRKVGNATIQRPDGNMNKSDDTVKEMSEWGGSGTTKLCHTGARSDETFQRSSTITHQPSIEGQHCPTSPKALQAVAIWQLDMIAVLVRCSIRDQLIYESCQVLLCLLPCLG